jgi:hypothetical protein
MKRHLEALRAVTVGAIVCLAAIGKSVDAQPACNCAVPPSTKQCSAAALALADANATAQIRAAREALIARPDLIRGAPAGRQMSPVTAQIAYQQARREYGDSAVSAAIGMPLTSITRNHFDTGAFRDELARAALALHPAGVNYFLFQHGRSEMTAPGDPSPPDVTLPDGRPVRVVSTPTGNCWTPIQNAQPDDGVASLKGAFGLNFPEVGRLVRARTAADGQVELFGGCAFVLLSARWAATALHCVADQAAPGQPWILGTFKNDSSGPWNGERALFLGQTARLKSFPGGCFGGPDVCPWKQLRVAAVHPPPNLTANPAAPRLPLDDIALIELSAGVATPINYPTFTPSTVSGGTVTLVAYGAVAAPFWQFFELQVGWNFSGTTSSDGETFTWDPSKTTMQSSICPGDSGGAVFSGYENGGCRCDGGAPNRSRRLAGLISFVNLPAGAEDSSMPALVKSCQTSSRAGAVLASHYKNWICGVASDIAACR